MYLHKVGLWTLTGFMWLRLGTGGRWQAHVTAVTNLQVSFSAGNFLTSCGTVIFSTTALLAVGSFVT
jgi:hypothetical protein